MNKIMNTKFWLIIIAFMHTILGILMPMLEYGNIDNLGIFLYFLVLSVHLFYVIIFTENQTQNKLSVILCAPMVIWFVISSIMKLEMFGFPIASMPNALVEVGFLSNPSEEKQLKQNGHKQKIAEAIFQAIKVFKLSLIHI